MFLMHVILAKSPRQIGMGIVNVFIDKLKFLVIITFVFFSVGDFYSSLSYQRNSSISLTILREYK